MVTTCKASEKFVRCYACRTLGHIVCDCCSPYAEDTTDSKSQFSRMDPLKDKVGELTSNSSRLTDDQANSLRLGTGRVEDGILVGAAKGNPAPA